MNRLSQTLNHMESLRRQRASKVTGWLFAGVIFMMGFIAGALIF